MSEIISVILPTYNRAHTLDRAIGSVVHQSYPHWHLYIVDDASTDSSLECVQHWLKKSDKISLLSMSVNRGVSAARNLGLQKARGSYISFIDSDDEWLPEKLSQQISYFASHPEHRLVHGEEIWVRRGVRVNPMKKHQKRGGWVFSDCLKLCCISPSTVMLKKEIFEEVGVFREDFPACEDYDLWLRICAKEPVGFLEDPLIVKYGGHEDQLSRKYKAMDYWRVLALHSLVGDRGVEESFRKQALEELAKKRAILLKGYRKHENLKAYDEVFALCKD